MNKSVSLNLQILKKLLVFKSVVAHFDHVLSFNDQSCLSVDTGLECLPPPLSPFRNMKVQQEDYCILPISALLEIMKIKVRFYFGRKSTRASLDELLVFSSKDNSFNMKRKYSFTCIYIVHLKKKINCNKRLGIHVISIYILRSSLVNELILNSHSVLIKKVNKSDNFVQ